MDEGNNNNTNNSLDPNDLQSSEDYAEVLLETMELRIIESLLVHPIIYAKKLIQIGHEPLPPSQANLFFIGPSMLILPNMFVYVKHIYNVDGFTGCFRGLVARICFNLSSAVAYRSFLMNNLDEIKNAIANNNVLELIKWDILATTVATIFSHPFYVLSNRQMASFVGHETTYNGLFTGLYTIAVNEGITSWFNGFMPRLVGDVAEIIVFYTMFFIIHKYIIQNRAYRPFITFVSTYFAALVAYPYHVVSVCMSVNGSELKAGLPPFVPYFQQNWFKCYNYLSKHNQIRRGESIFWRPFIPPTN